MPDTITPKAGFTYPAAGDTDWFATLESTFNRADHLAPFAPERNGAVGNGVANDASPIADTVAAIDAAGGGVLWLAKGKTYLVPTLDLIAGCSNLIVAGGGKLKTTSTAYGAFFTFTGKTNVLFYDVLPESPNDRAVLASYNTATTDVVHWNVRCTKARLYETNMAMTYAAADTGTAGAGGNVCRRIYAFGCTGAGIGSGAVVGNRAFITRFYCVGGTSLGCSARGYASGEQWWGGDANPAVDGALTNERKTGDYSVSGHSYRDMSIGGVWGSMGKDTSIGVGHVEDCLDVGFDDEGGENVSFKGGTARNCVNGGIASFFLGRNISFDVNVETDTLNGSVAQVKNLTQSHDKTDVTIRGSYTCNSGIGLVLCEVSASLNLDITCTNVWVNAKSNNQGDSTIKVKSRFTRVAGAAFDAVSAGYTHNQACVLDVEAYTTVAQPAGSRAVRVTQAVAATNTVDVKCRGWGTTPVTIVSEATNPAAIPKTWVSGHLGEGTTVERIETATKSLMWLENLRNDLGARSIPSAVPGSGYWDVGQVAYFAAPAAGGNIGSVCVTAGTPGTWKSFGAIAA